MKLVKFRTAENEPMIGVWEEDEVRRLALDGRQYRSLAEILEDEDLLSTVNFLLDRNSKTYSIDEVQLLAPIDQQEVWAAGVTYRRSQVARMEESEVSADVYDRVYEADRPELFFKAQPHRVVGPEGTIRIRQDSEWSVPEPELALVLNSRLQLVGYTVGNDVSARDIEGDNPLYLPQAKVYDQCCSLGPCITLADSMPDLEEVTIQLEIFRNGELAVEGTTSLDQMARTFADLIHYLGRDSSFPCGAFLLTGTGIVPPSDFTLLSKDEVAITIDGIGTLFNSVVQG
ncbi:Fumarylacetoacetate hydrolase [Planctomycetales bacterium 10988]|nr:Fumarylacetoacetate hydrolase [Planctomycetales bacterium 10988]